MLQEFADKIIPEVEKLREMWKEFIFPIDRWKITIEFSEK